MSSENYLNSLSVPVGACGELVCFHHAGGSGRFFQDWGDDFAPTVAITAAELPGRGRRFGESIPETLHEVAAAIVEEFELADRPVQGPTVLFGHSLGAGLAYEVGRRLEKTGYDLSRVVVSGTPTPHADYSDKQHHKMSDKELQAELREMGGTPPKVIEQPDLMELFLPIIRADFRLFETYAPEELEPLSCPLTAIGGEEDEDLSTSRLKEWHEYTEAEFASHLFPGGHFYLKHHRPMVLDWLKHHLEAVGAFTPK